MPRKRLTLDPSIDRHPDLRCDPPPSTVPRENFGGAGRPGEMFKQYKRRKKEPKESASGLSGLGSIGTR